MDSRHQVPSCRHEATRRKEALRHDLLQTAARLMVDPTSADDLTRLSDRPRRAVHLPHGAVSSQVQCMWQRTGL